MSKAAQLTPEELLANLKANKSVKFGDATKFDVNFNDIDSFGNQQSLLDMVKNIGDYNKMLDERITLINDALTAAIPFTRENLYLFCAYTGSGKCFSKGTSILMYDGTSKNVEDVVVGDLVMGADSKPRTVISLARGKEEMYDIIPVKGDKYTVNESHILSLRKSSTNEHSIINISVKDYLKQKKYFKHIYKGYRTGVAFEAKPVKVNPYLLGYWLGDGSSDELSFCTQDHEVVNEILQTLNFMNKNESKEFPIALNIVKTTKNTKAKTYRLSTGKKSGQKGRNYIKNSFKELNLFNNKHIPHVYKTNSRKIRLELLAGLIDSDGSSESDGLDICFKSKTLAEDTTYLCRSLGFAAYMKKIQKTCTNSKNKTVGTYYRISISGDLDQIPCRILRKKRPARKQIKNVLNTGIEVVPAGVGDYYGFSVDGDHLFLLSDFTVVHNSTVAANISFPLWKQEKKTLVISNEESQSDVLFRIGCLELGYSFSDYKKGKMPLEQQKHVIALFPSISKYVKVLDVNYKNGLTTKLEGIKNALESIKDKDYSCVMIDYYQLIQTSAVDLTKTRYDVLNELRIWLGQYIKRSNIPVVLFAQLYSLSKKGGAKDVDARIKECSAVVEPATVIVEIVPDFELNTTDFYIAKDRFGYAGHRIPCAFEKGRYVVLSQDSLIERQSNAKRQKAERKLSELTDTIDK